MMKSFFFIAFAGLLLFSCAPESQAKKDGRKSGKYSCEKEQHKRAMLAFVDNYYVEDVLSAQEMILSEKGFTDLLSAYDRSTDSLEAISQNYENNDSKAIYDRVRKGYKDNNCDVDALQKKVGSFKKTDAVPGSLLDLRIGSSQSASAFTRWLVFGQSIVKSASGQFDFSDWLSQNQLKSTTQANAKVFFLEEQNFLIENSSLALAQLENEKIRLKNRQSELEKKTSAAIENLNSEIAGIKEDKKKVLDELIQLFRQFFPDQRGFIKANMVSKSYRREFAETKQKDLLSQYLGELKKQHFLGGAFWKAFKLKHACLNKVERNRAITELKKDHWQFKNMDFNFPLPNEIQQQEILEALKTDVEKSIKRNRNAGYVFLENYQSIENEKFTADEMRTKASELLKLYTTSFKQTLTKATAKITEYETLEKNFKTINTQVEGLHKTEREEIAADLKKIQQELSQNKTKNNKGKNTLRVVAFKKGSESSEQIIKIDPYPQNRISSPYASFTDIAQNKDNTPYLMSTSGKTLTLKKYEDNQWSDAKMEYQLDLSAEQIISNPNMIFVGKKLYCLINIENKQGEVEKMKLLEFGKSSLGFGNTFKLNDTREDIDHLLFVKFKQKQLRGVDLKLDQDRRLIICLLDPLAFNAASQTNQSNLSLYVYDLEDQSIQLKSKETISFPANQMALLPVDFLSLNNFEDRQDWWLLLPKANASDAFSNLQISADEGTHWHPFPFSGEEYFK